MTFAWYLMVHASFRRTVVSTFQTKLSCVDVPGCCNYHLKCSSFRGCCFIRLLVQFVCVIFPALPSQPPIRPMPAKISTLTFFPYHCTSVGIDKLQFWSIHRSDLMHVFMLFAVFAQTRAKWNRVCIPHSYWSYTCVVLLLFSSTPVYVQLVSLWRRPSACPVENEKYEYYFH